MIVVLFYFAAVLTFTAALTGHTDATRALAHLFTDALEDAHIARGLAAEEIGMRESHFSAALARRERIDFLALAALGPAFWLAFGTLLVKRAGGEVIPPSLCEVFRGAAHLQGKKRMARMTVTLPLAAVVNE